MSRRNIFDILKSDRNIRRETERLGKLFEDYNFVSLGRVRDYSLYKFVDEYCFNSWANRGKCLDAHDFLETLLGEEYISEYSPNSVDDFLIVAEIIYNFWYMATRLIDKTDEPIEYDETKDILKKMLDDCLSDYNQKAYYFPEKEQCIISEDSPQVTAAAEAVDTEIAIDIVRYHHHQLEGEIEKKRIILKKLADFLEGRKKQITGINNELYKTIGGGLNNLNIRHNNTDPGNKTKYKKAVAEMPIDELETHYDDLYQLILLAILEMDNVGRQKEMKELIQQISDN